MTPGVISLIFLMLNIFMVFWANFSGFSGFQTCVERGVRRDGVAFAQFIY